VNNILLSASDDRLENGIRGDAQIEWVEYKAWQEDFEVYLAPANAEEGELIGTSSTSTFTFQKPEEVGNYKVWVKTARADLVYTANSNQLFFEIEQRDIKVPNVITPNGDGANDFFLVEGLEYYPQNTVQLFNRWGQVVFTANNYTNNYSPTDLESGTYYYKVIVPDEPEQNGPIRIIK
jgi:gliding motility-associated-like protein